MKLLMCALMLILLPAVSLVHAEESWVQKSSINLKATYASKYMWRGYDVQNDVPAFQSDLSFNVSDTGLYAGLWYSAALYSRQEWGDWDEIDGYVGYSQSLFSDKKYSLEYDAAFTHYYFFRIARANDTKDVMLSLKLPNALPFFGSYLVPRVKGYYAWNPHFESLYGFWIAVAAMYDFPLPSLINAKGDRKLSWILESYHCDCDKKYAKAAGWYNVMTGFSTTVEWNGFTCEPGMNYQWSLKHDINPENEFWFMLSVSRDIR
ncbi:MAG: TorF family putative porin [Candidatus Latescibacterota bacterium]